MLPPRLVKIQLFQTLRALKNTVEWVRGSGESYSPRKSKSTREGGHGQWKKIEQKRSQYNLPKPVGHEKDEHKSEMTIQFFPLGISSKINFALYSLSENSWCRFIFEHKYSHNAEGCKEERRRSYRVIQSLNASELLYWKAIDALFVRVYRGGNLLCIKKLWSASCLSIFPIEFHILLFIHFRSYTWTWTEDASRLSSDYTMFHSKLQVLGTISLLLLPT